MALKSEKDENPFEPPIDEDFLKTALEYRDNFEDDEDFQEALAIWPRCPQCGRRRVTRCPICKTSGTLFPLGDRDFYDFRSDEERARDAEIFEAASRRKRACGPNGRSCGCGSRDCDDAETEVETVFADLPEKRRRRRAWAELGSGAAKKRRNSCACDAENAAENADSEPLETPELVVCFVCSEAFEPTFPRRCEWCDYDFGDGEDPNELDDAATAADVAEFVARKEAERALAELDAPSETRVFWTLAALGAAGAALLGYFAFLFR